ncbi:MAG: ATP-binding protein [Candidatus Latescibacterota bacterium]|nr:MAG: ATP-binding protein [Candidatus Latescibacterota bacterium]
MKKLSVCGKGGSGKSTLAALLAMGLRDRGYKVLVIDSDESNPGLYRMLGFRRRPEPLIDLVGGKKKVFGTFRSPEPPKNVLTQDEISTSDIPEPYIEEKNGIKMVCIGKILQSLEGCACPMGVLSREFLKRLNLREKEVAVVDMEAGIEHFGRGVETSLDSVLVVVEPSLDSLELAVKIKSLASEAGLENSWAVLNKVPSEDVGSRLRRELREKGVDVVGSLSYDPDLFLSSLEGRPLRAGRAAKDIEKILDILTEGNDG